MSEGNGAAGRTKSIPINSVEGRKYRAERLKEELGIDLFAQYPRERIAGILNLSQQLVLSAADGLIRKKRLRLEDGCLYFEAKPEIALAERKDMCTHVLDSPEFGGIPPAVYRRFDQKLKDFGAPEDMCTDVLRRVLAVRTRFLGALKDMRYQEREGYNEVSTYLDNLYVQSTPQSPERTYVSLPSPAQNAPPAQTPPLEGGDNSAPKYLPAKEWAPRRRQRFSTNAFPSCKTGTRARPLRCSGSATWGKRIGKKRTRFSTPSKAATGQRIRRAVDAAEVHTFMDHAELLLDTKQSPRAPRGPQSIAWLVPVALKFAEDRPRRRRRDAELQAKQERSQKAAAERAAAHEAEIALHYRVESVWQNLPSEEREKRLAFAKATLKAEPRWLRISPELRAKEAEAWAVNKLKKELAEKEKASHA